MSYDVYMGIDTGGEWRATVFAVGNYTSNYSFVWNEAVRHGSDGAFESLRAMDGVTGADAIPILERGSSYLWRPEVAARLRLRDPANGWGSFDGAREYFDKILAACRLHPLARIGISS